jgi:hypothetical protein
MSELRDSKSVVDAHDTQLHLAYAEASVMLLECVMLVLIERKVVPLDALVDAVETAVEAKNIQVKDLAHPQIAAVAAGVLRRIANSLAAAGHGAQHSPE